MAEKMVELMFGPGAKKKIQQLSLSNDTIRLRIDMAADVCQQVCSEIKQSTLQASVQLDESTDIALESHLIFFARYEKEGKMKEEFLFCNTLPTTTTAVDVKAIVNSFFEADGLGWQNFKHICTDGAPAMLGVRGGFVTLVKNGCPHVTSSHCSLHRYALASKTLPPRLMEVMDVAVKVINFIRARAKNHRLFQLLATEIISTTRQEGVRNARSICHDLLCESGFSDLASIKTKSRNRLDVRSDIRLAVSKTEPNVKGLLRRAVSH